MKSIKYKSNCNISYPITDQFLKARKMIPSIIECIKNNFNKDEKIQLVCRGTSGLTLSTLLLNALLDNNINVDEHMIIVRKNVSSHTSYSNFNNISLNNHLIIVDDFICSGTTITTIISKLLNFFPYENKTSLLLFEIRNDVHFVKKFFAKTTLKPTFFITRENSYNQQYWSR